MASINDNNPHVHNELPVSEVVDDNENNDDNNHEQDRSHQNATTRKTRPNPVIDHNTNDTANKSNANHNSKNKISRLQANLIERIVDVVRQRLRRLILNVYRKCKRKDRITICGITLTPIGVSYMFLSIISLYISRRFYYIRYNKRHIGDKEHIRTSVAQQQQRQPQSATNNQNFHYNNATIVPLSFLLQLIQKHQKKDNGDIYPKVLQKILIGTNRILFQTTSEEPSANQNNDVATRRNKQLNSEITTSTSQWKSVQLPSSTTSAALHQHILSLITSFLTKSQNIELSILPEKDDKAIKSESDYSSTISTLLITSVPFLYLAMVYRMIQKSTGNQSSLTDSGNDIQNLIYTNQYTKSMIRSSKRNNSTSILRSENGDDFDNVTFNDIAGIDSAVIDMKEIVRFIHQPILFERYGAQITRGILLFGPPGCGKTMLVRALSNEIGNCPFISCSASNFVEIYVGRGAARVRSLFHMIRRYALQSYVYQKEQEQKQKSQNRTSIQRLLHYIHSSSTTTSPDVAQPLSEQSGDTARRSCVAILFIDELDALAKTRSSGGTRGGIIHSNDEREQTLNQLLTEMDGFHSSNAIALKNSSPRLNSIDEQQLPPKPIIIVVGATNRVDVLDPAILRRFDRHIHVGYPNERGRKEILQVHSRQRHSRATTTSDICTNRNNPIDWDHLAKITQNMSGSDLRQIVNEATLLAIRENCNSTSECHGRNATVPYSHHEIVTQQHLEKAILRHQQRSSLRKSGE